MAQLIQDIKPRGIDSAYVIAPFDVGKEELESKGYKIISLEENARLRISEGKNADVSKNGNWTRERVLYLLDKRILLTKNSPIIDNAKVATDCHRNGRDFYLTDEQVQKSLADSIEIKDRKVPTNRFGENELTVYAFGEVAKQYGEFLKEAGIEQMPVLLADVQTKPFARQMWFGSLDYRSGLRGAYRGLNCNDWVRGVRVSGAEGTQKNFVQVTQVFPYTQDQLDSYLETAQGLKEGRTESLQAAKLEELILGLKEFLKSEKISRKIAYL